MDRHLLALVLVGGILLAGAAAPAVVAVAAAGVCNPCNIADQVNLFCPFNDSKRSCCDVVTFVMDAGAGHDGSPACLCSLDDCQDFLVTGYSFDDLLDMYIGCGGEHPGDAQQLVDSCDDGP